MADLNSAYITGFEFFQPFTNAWVGQQRGTGNGVSVPRLSAQT